MNTVNIHEAKSHFSRLIARRSHPHVAGDFLRALLAAVPYKVHTVLTDNGTHFTSPGNTCSAAAEIKRAMERGEWQVARYWVIGSSMGLVARTWAEAGEDLLLGIRLEASA